MVEIEQCAAEIVLGEGAKDSSCTFRCELPAGHPNYHQNTGSQAGQRYEILWWSRPEGEPRS